MNEVAYKYYPTTSKFHHSDKFVRGLMGPIGSGKSVACCWELMKLGNLQEPDQNGVRRTRWAVIRNTYRELVDTTMKTWFDWFPEEIGVFRKTDSTFHIVQNLPDGTVLDMEILFRALDKPKDIKKLLSLEITGAWVNEAREIPVQVVEMIQGRCGRFPSKKDLGPTWWGVIMDTNPPDSDHWWYKIFEEKLPENWELFRQPSGLSDEAENIENLVPGYYTNMSSGKDPEWLEVYVHGNYGFISDGRPVFPMFNDSIHFNVNIKYNPQLPVHIGVDFGLTPACVFMQENANGRYEAIDEITTEYADAFMFGDLIKERCKVEGYKLSNKLFGDPAGNQRSQADSKTPFKVMDAKGVHLSPTKTNDPDIRIGAVVKGLTELAMDGIPRLTIGPKCRMLRKAFNGGYAYKRMQVSGGDIYKDAPEKNHYSHVSDAAQYICVGLGLGEEYIYGKDVGHRPKVITGIK